MSGATCAEEFNLRSAIVAYASTHTPVGGAVSAKHKDQLAASDVKWSHGRFDSTIATAAANGRIVVYDINRTGVELARLHEHNRQVHKIAFNPFEGALLLSGSQDSTVKLWDLRAMSRGQSVMTCRSMHRYIGNNEGVRDLKWSPTDGVEFATGTDNGVVQRWDLRKENAPLLKINAHDKTCHSIDWHPDGNHLASGSADKNIKVWDFKSTDRRLKPSWQFRAPQAVVNVRWRPPCWSNEIRGQGSWQCTHLATSYDQRDPRVHLWDFRRPNIPSREFDRYNSAPTDLLWHSEDLLWTVGNEGMFTQTDIHFAPKTLKRRSPNALDWSPHADVSVFSQKRPPRRGSGIEDASAEFLNSSKGRGASGDKTSGSQSATDGSLEDGFLSSSFKKCYSKTSGTRSSKSVGNTPPSASNAMAVVKLDEALDLNGPYEPSASIAGGYVAGTFDAHVFSYLAKNYMPPLEDVNKFICPYRLDKILHEMCKENAAHAEYAGQFRLSQTWRIIGLALEKELGARASDNRHQRVYVNQATRKFNQLISSREPNYHNTHAARTEKFQDHIFKGTVETKRQPLNSNFVVESSSNMTTPLARPVSGPSVPKDLPMDLVYDVDQRTSLAIPRIKIKSSSSTESMESGEGTIMVHGSIPKPSNLPSDEEPVLQTEDLHEWRERYHEERRAAIENYRPSPRPVLHLEHPISLEDRLMSDPLKRHDSIDSFPMFSASTDSSHRDKSMAGSFAESEKLGSLGQTPDDWNERLVHPIVREPKDVKIASGISLQSRGQHIFLTEKESPKGTEIISAQDKSDGYKKFDTERISACDPNNRQSSLYPQSPPSYSEHSRKMIVNAIPIRAGALPPGGALLSEPGIVNASFIPSDFTSRPKDSPCAFDVTNPPWEATKMFPQLVDFYSRNTSDAQMPTHLLFLLRLMLDPMDEHTLLAPHQAESLLTSYHAQLHSLGLYVPATQVRKFSSEMSPDLAEQGMMEVHVHLWCRQCQKPLENKGQKWVKSPNQWICERCRSLQAPCPICWGRNTVSGYLNSSLSSSSATTDQGEKERAGNAGRTLWSSCLICGHGGHDSCIKAWFEDTSMSEGGCPVLGCLHDCVPGIRRDEKIKMIAEEQVKKKRGMAKRDSWVVGESKAVEKARNSLQSGIILGESSAGNISLASGGLHSVLTSTGGGAGKRVRLVAPDEEPQESVEERKSSEARPIPKS